MAYFKKKKIVFCVKLYVAAIFFLLSFNHAVALEINSSVSYLREINDNIFLTEDARESERSNIYNYSIALTGIASQIDYSINGDIAYIDYEKNLANDRFNINLISNVNWYIVPRSFEWAFDNITGYIPINSSLPNIQENLQIVNFFSTGPRFSYSITKVDTFNLDYRYQDIYEEKTNNDLVRNISSVQLLHRTSKISNISLNVEYSTVDYKISPINDYTNNRYFIGMNSRTQRTTYLLEIGEAVVQGFGTQEYKDTIGQLLINRQFNRTLSGALQYVSDFRDSSRDIENIRSGNNQNITSSSSANVFKNEIFTLRFNKISYFWNMQFELYARTQDYLTANLDEDSYGGRFNLNKRLFTMFNVGLGYDAENSDFINFSRKDSDRRYNIFADYRIKRNILLRTQIIKTKRASTSVVNNYVENRFRIGIEYDF
jgi:hypothetical protein